MDNSKRHQLVADWLEGKLSESASAMLLEELQHDPEFRKSTSRQLLVKRYLDQRQIPPGGFTTEVLETLREERDETLTSGVITNLQNLKRRQQRLIRGSLVLAAAAVIVLAFFLTFGSKSDSPGIRVIASEGVGTLNIAALEQGQEVVLPRGILELDLNEKARVVIEAPASFKVISPLHIRLNKGRLFAEMKKGTSGLKVETPSGEILDLGTEFGVEVLTPKEMTIHVFDGIVEVSDGKGKRRLSEGEGIAVVESGELTPLPSNSGSFVSHVPRTGTGQEPLLYWSFDEGQGSVVQAKGTDPNVELGNGTLKSHFPKVPGPKWIPGVLGKAIEFDRQGGWIETQHPGISGSRDRTVACWIRLPDEDQGEVAPIISWGATSRRKSQNKSWILSIAQYSNQYPENYGRMRFNVGRRPTMGSTNLRDGKWHHIAVVTMRGKGGPATLMYVDGQLENVDRKAVYINTTTDPADSAPIRFGRHLFYGKEFLRGAIDECYIYEKALSGDEIRQLMHR